MYLMKILMLTDSFYPEIGGSETAIWRLSDALIEANLIIR